MTEQDKAKGRFGALVKNLLAVPKSEVDKLRAKEAKAKKRSSAKRSAAQG